MPSKFNSFKFAPEVPCSAAEDLTTASSLRTYDSKETTLLVQIFRWPESSLQVALKGTRSNVVADCGGRQNLAS